MPTDHELAEAKARIKEFVRLADDIGVWYGSTGNKDGVSVNRLQVVFKYYARLARDFPKDRGRVGRFLADVLLPDLLRAIDASMRDLGPEGGGSLEPIVGRIFLNQYAMERWHAEVEARLLKGQDGFTNVYWVRDRHEGFPKEQARASLARYQSLRKRCVERPQGCDSEVLRGLRRMIEDYSKRLADT